MNLSVSGTQVPTARNADLIEAIQRLGGCEPLTVKQITGNGIIVARQRGTGVGDFWYVVISDVMTEDDWGELDDLSAELKAPWNRRILEAEMCSRPNRLLPGSTYSILYTVHPEAHS
ncbi:hypothetical protein [Streptomyces sp. NPDC014733]|uniref:hypothetical protein n=1 Tax=Streptomyces sp. NPDC014733 TaxID=3364885 RepID=UPI0036FC36AD